MAKGIRKPRSRKRGALEVFSHARFSAARGKNLDIVTEVELIDSLDSIRRNLKKTAVAYFLVEVVRRLTREGEKNEKYYVLILKYLKMLKKSKALRELRENFIFDSLVILGFWPKDRKMDNPDLVLSDIIERELSSVRVGKKMLT
jgi:DNA repair protein RecO (recombination protein O)